VLQIKQRAEEWKSAQGSNGNCLFRVHGQHRKQVSSHDPAVPALATDTEFTRAMILILTTPHSQSASHAIPEDRL